MFFIFLFLFSRDCECVCNFKSLLYKVRYECVSLLHCFNLFFSTIIILFPSVVVDLKNGLKGVIVEYLVMGAFIT